MKPKTSIIAAFLLICFFSLNLAAQNIQKYSKAKVYLQAGDLNRLASLGVAVDDGEVKKDKYIIAEFSSSEIEIIKNNGFQYEVLIDDMAAFYAERNKKEIQEGKKKSENVVNCFENKFTTPQYFSLGSVGGFYSYEEIMDELDSMHVRFPNLVTARQAASTDNTIEGRSIWYVKISDNPDIDETEPEIMYCALTHAREPQGMQQLFFYLYYLLENYNTNPTVKYIVDNTEIFFVPCVNPDGYKYNQTTNPNGGGMHRKNCRQTGAVNFGIDLNRNYGYMWGYDNIGSSPNPESLTYRGTAAFSENETSIMRDFCLSRDFKMIMDCHCYSNVLLFPWSYENLLTPDDAIYQLQAAVLTKENGFAYGTPYQALGYNANGGSMDWFYGEQTVKNKIITFSPEAGSPEDGFWPAMSRIEPISKSFADMNFQFSLMVGKYAKIEDNSPYIISNAGYLKFQIQNLGLDTPATFTVSLIPITSNIAGTGSPKVYSNLQLLASKIDSFAYNLDAFANQGSRLKFIYKIETENGVYYSDTIVKIYGMPSDVFYDAANSTTNWVASSSWGTTTSTYYSPPKSFTDSPIGNYGSNVVRTFTTTNFINIANASYAELSFWAKWEIEMGYDYVEIMASTNGITWTPLCGKYAKPGTAYQNPNSPIYDGMQTTWVFEKIDLSDFIGQSIKLRFQLTSDDYVEKDGFYFDDLKISIIENTTGLTKNLYFDNFSVSPNPFTDKIMVKIPAVINQQKNSIEIISLLGKKYKTIITNPHEEEITIDLQDLPKGIYILNLNNFERIKIVK